MRRLIALLLLLLLPPLAGQAENTWYIRVVGRDDTPAAQAEKLRVRDTLLPLCPDDPAGLAAALPRLSAALSDLAPGTVSIRPWAPLEHPLRPTLYITLGEGKGHNWWGVLYEGAVEMAGAEDAQDADTVDFVWPWWEWLMGLLGF